MEDELLDLVDEQDNVIAKLPRSRVYAQGMSNYRCTCAFIKNSAGELWIPRRAAHKQLFPLCLDMSVAGHVKSGESYDEALKHEVFEELRMDLTRFPPRLLGKLSPKDGTHEWQQVYEIHSDAEPDYNRNDFMSAKWYTPQALLAAIEKGEPCVSDLPVIVKHFYA